MVFKLENLPFEDIQFIFNVAILKLAVSGHTTISTTRRFHKNIILLKQWVAVSTTHYFDLSKLHDIFVGTSGHYCQNSGMSKHQDGQCLSYSMKLIENYTQIM